ncbi:MAG: hypothetical protein JXX29_11095 [Deltaproteobacteria bacterium]|nr:hypothetical protein [Deltaproteobacteria bacterium]MBN2672216.1 hypothetical protein [Deltaproteobacteria bacterium]
MKWNQLILSFILTALCISAVPAVSAAKSPGGFTGDEIKNLLPLLRQHDAMGLTEYDDKGAPKSMTLAIRIAAKRETVFQLFTDPANFYYVSTLFKENTVLDEHQNAMVWSWASRHKILSVTGKNSIALYPPRRADVTIENSSVGNGTFTFQFYNDKDTHTILVISGFLNVDSSEWLIKFLVGNNPSMKQAMNIAIGLVVLKGFKELAERTERKRPQRPHRTFGESGGVPQLLGTKELTALKPYLLKGQLFICDSHKQGRLKQATVVELVDSSKEAFIEAAAVPRNYEKRIGAISNVKVIKQEELRTEFSWTIGLSIFGLNSVNALQREPNTVMLSAISGDLSGAVWRWQVEALGENRSVVAYHAFADVAEMSPILKSTVKREPYLEHGLVLGSNIVMMKAMKQIAEESK